MIMNTDKRTNEVVESILTTRKNGLHTTGSGMAPLLGTGNGSVSSDFKDMLATEAKVKLNEAIEEGSAEWDKKLEEQLQHAKDIDNRMANMQIMPVGNYVLVQPYAKNPFQKLKKMDSGLIIPEYEGLYKNTDSGDMEHEENLSVQALVVEVSPYNKFVKEGDVVFYRRACGVPIPFFGQGFEVVAEQQIQAIVNSDLKERFSKIVG